jgi:hypothetical protein
MSSQDAVSALAQELQQSRIRAEELAVLLEAERKVFYLTHHTSMVTLYTCIHVIWKTRSNNREINILCLRTFFSHPDKYLNVQRAAEAERLLKDRERLLAESQRPRVCAFNTAITAITEANVILHR